MLKLKLSTLFLLMVICQFSIVVASEVPKSFGYSYEKITTEHNLFHIVRINNKDYIANIVKANDALGRETVDSIAKRTKSDIAINGGFFMMGGKNNGKPTGTLVAEGKNYKIVKKIQSLLVINSGIISLVSANPMNYFKRDSSNISILSGIPMLISNGKITEGVYKNQSNFYKHPHARTALGVDKEGNIIIVLVEHFYIHTMDNLRFKDLKNILKQEILSKDRHIGLTIPDLAKLMQDLGCHQALNLDGGGSATLWINGEVVNNAIGDSDESNAEKIVRPVSDAIIFRILH